MQDWLEVTLPISFFRTIYFAGRGKYVHGPHIPTPNKSKFLNMLSAKLHNTCEIHFKRLDNTFLG